MLWLIMRFSFKLFFITGFFILLYTAFWYGFFQKSLVKDKLAALSPVTSDFYEKNNTKPLTQNAVKEDTNVLSSTDEKQQLPIEYKLNVTPRRQKFNLSCEFAAAAAIIHHYTNDKFFAPENQVEAEKELMKKVGVSNNPNVGIRMGQETPEDDNKLLQNMNKKFGGADYYGVHAPPFLDLFPEYKLTAVPLDKKNAIQEIQQAIFHGHLVMAWIKTGYGESIDLALSYGSVPVIKGEHVIVIVGYNADGIIVMDPASGVERNISNAQLLESISPFSLPLLEVYPSTVNSSLYSLTDTVTKASGLERYNVKISVLNGSGEQQAAHTMAEVLRDFGYHIVTVRKANNTEYEDVSIVLKKQVQDYIGLLEKDLRLANYKVASVSSGLGSETSDIVITVGR